MKFIGLDVAAVTGWAFIASSGDGPSSSNHWELGTCRADSPAKHDVLAWAKEHGVTHAVTEKPMPFKGSHASVGQSMNQSYGRWLEACAVAGIEVVPCMVVHWQNEMLVVNGRKLGNKDKAGSLTVAKALGAHPRNGDEADAVCLCAYGARAMQRFVDAAEEKKVVAKMRRRVRKDGAK